MGLDVNDILVAAQHQARRLAIPGECMWKVVQSDTDICECEVKFESTTATWLAMIYKNGWPVSGQRFPHREKAVAWAAIEYKAIKDGHRRHG
jgi:hypothetical protein